jgi:hypothetical protein
MIASMHDDQHDDVTLSEEDGVVTVRLHRPAKRNAIIMRPAESSPFTHVISPRASATAGAPPEVAS